MKTGAESIEMTGFQIKSGMKTYDISTCRSNNI
jgi:hypothetical protein